LRAAELLAMGVAHRELRGEVGPLIERAFETTMGLAANPRTA